MRIPGVKTLKRFSRWAHARMTGGALILGYHRVIDAEDDFQIGVTPTHFAEHLEILRKYANPIPMSDLVAHIKHGTTPPRTVAVTFDDGYVDNFQTALPLLQKHQIPATLFVCTDFAGKCFWWDELAWLIHSPASLPHRLDLMLPGTPFAWDSRTSSKSKLLASLHLLLLSLGPDERTAAMEKIRQWASAPAFDAAGHRAMTPAELLQLAQTGRVEIGSHTRTHPVLTRLSIEEQMDEIGASRKYLESILERPIPGFSYPNGTFNASICDRVKEAGFTYACMSDSGLARKPDVMYRLPRLWPRNWDGDEFLKFLRLWLPA